MSGPEGVRYRFVAVFVRKNGDDSNHSDIIGGIGDARSEGSTRCQILGRRGFTQGRR